VSNALCEGDDGTHLWWEVIEKLNTKLLSRPGGNHARRLCLLLLFLTYMIGSPNAVYPLVLQEPRRDMDLVRSRTIPDGLAETEHCLHACKSPEAGVAPKEWHQIVQKSSSHHVRISPEGEEIYKTVTKTHTKTHTQTNYLTLRALSVLKVFAQPMTARLARARGFTHLCVLRS
jgi:hypothetical protein